MGSAGPVTPSLERPDAHEFSALNVLWALLLFGVTTVLGILASKEPRLSECSFSLSTPARADSHTLCGTVARRLNSAHRTDPARPAIRRSRQALFQSPQLASVLVSLAAA